eukprot:m.18098 g.18098  ORF g.18098 m.18098 type:complete len:55 (-) comp8423_c0_seq2:387-551(-)
MNKSRSRQMATTKRKITLNYITNQAHASTHPSWCGDVTLLEIILGLDDSDIVVH